jgi:hypothetical protein
MQSDRALQMVPAITEWSVGPALVAGPQFIGETARRQAPRPSRGLEPVETAAALHPTASLRLRLAGNGTASQISHSKLLDGFLA